MVKSHTSPLGLLLDPNHLCCIRKPSGEVSGGGLDAAKKCANQNLSLTTKGKYILQDLKTLHPNHLNMLDPLDSFGMVSCHGLTLSTLVVTEIRLQWNFKENYM